jgi:hypothetical protein
MNAQPHPTLFDLPSLPVRTKPAEPIFRAAEIEKPYRWTASRRWGPGPICAWLGNNPSDADGARDDPSMWRMMGFSFRWGFGGLVVLNVTPFIASKMADCRAWLQNRDCNPAVSISQAENAKRIAKALEHVDLAIACFGNLAPKSEVDLLFCYLEHEHHLTVDWHCIGTTNSGAPTHPMARGKHRVPDDAKAVRWDFADWLDEEEYH